VGVDVVKTSTKSDFGFFRGWSLITGQGVRHTVVRVWNTPDRFSELKKILLFF